MTFHIEGKKILINEDMVKQYTDITHDSLNAMQLILTVMLRNILDIDNPEEIVQKYSDEEIKEVIETRLKKEISMLS